MKSTNIKQPYSIIKAIEELTALGVEWTLMTDDNMGKDKAGFSFIVNDVAYYGDTALSVIHQGLQGYPGIEEKVDWNFEGDLLCATLKLADSTSTHYYMSPLNYGGGTTEVYLTTDSHQGATSNLIDAVGALIGIASKVDDETIEQFFIDETPENHEKDVESVPLDEQEYTPVEEESDDEPVWIIRDKDKMKSQKYINSVASSLDVKFETQGDTGHPGVDGEPYMELQDDPLEANIGEALTSIILDGWDFKIESCDKNKLVSYFNRGSESIVVVGDSLNECVDFFCDVIDDFSYFLRRG